MPSRGLVTWESLDCWRARAFIVGGALFLASPAAKGLTLVTAGSPPEWVVVLLAFSGLLASLVGLLGFYPGLSEQVPRHALAGAVATVLALGTTAGLFVWLIGTRVLAATSSLAAPGSPPAIVFVSLMAAIATGFAVVGTASLRAPASSRAVGVLLLALAVPWMVLLVAGAVYGSGLPVWLSLATYGAIPLGLLATGYIVRGHARSGGSEAASADVQAS